MATVNGEPHPEGIFSLLDTDLYKLTMQCAVLQHFPDIPVSYKFTNRTPHMKLNRRAFKWLQEQVGLLANIRVTDEEIAWLKKTCLFFGEKYLHFLKTFSLRPSEHVKLSFDASKDADEDDEAFGDLHIETHGLWIDTILYEIPLLALTSEAYFKFVDRDWTHDGQIENAKQKGLKLLEHGCVFSEFGTRRRRDYKAHGMVMQGLVAAQKEATSQHPDWRGKLGGTSNVHMAMRFGVGVVGTVAHEWYMGIAALTDDYANANEKAMECWVATFGRGVLGITLTDTFGTAAFLRSFTKPAPKSETLGTQQEGEDPSYAEIFAGVRQDSGDPMQYIKDVKAFYTAQGIKDKKAIVFSDSLNVDKCIRYKHACDEAGLTPSFGIGTFLTNDFRHASDPQKKSVPLNIVIKLSEAAGRPAVKLSDDKGKNMGDDALVRRIKKEVGYEERTWEGGDEAHRWDG
ncbi:hypothetical protein BAUCODRAFT_35624 [Baudoinia panamericana UAMH 10762]|uniref:Nicotinate phosphoribosyltransferase n=1 Tax=Baudoinia panamericana (strain UAMH 10762) TaxID=717646 RepID=M2MSC4_BAUPA|nr:uncharacterized protein BAUCODRAFT_35624 [Baudoinia panamericana UAMH 10762]EMC94403.1 hypothetical protein BAUCODRAFT_35624 [Baudoinia panamericana UAMH 10762]